jgi:histidine ammonia-lyase
VSGSATGTIEVDASPLTVDDIVAVADGAHVRLGPAALERIRAARHVVDALVAGDELIYGLNTGLGHMRDVRVSTDVLREYQTAIVASHAGAIGPPLPRRVVRAAMFARVVGIAAGGAGASPGVVDQLVALLERRVTPVVPAIGSVGAADLLHMACIAEVLIGEGRAEIDGEVLPGAEALARVGLSPIVLEPKDGLVAVSANGVAIGHAALVVDHARWVARLADVVFVASLEAINGNPSIVDPAVGIAKGLEGQIEAAARIRALLAGSDRCRAGTPMSVQDPLSFRVVPQVHGAFRASVDQLARATELELNALADNPLVVATEGRIVSNGNFAPMVLALAADALRPAIGHVGLLADRRLGHLFDRFVSNEAFAQPEDLEAAGADVGAALARYAAAARLTELRALADPVTLDVPVLDVGVEDHGSNAPLAVSRTDDALEVLEDILAIELATTRAFMRFAGAVARPGAGTKATLDALDAVLAPLGRRRSAEDARSAIRAALRSTVVPAAESAAGL